VYFEIDSAHPDNERFLADCEAWYGKKIERRRNAQYRDQFEVIEKTGYVNGPTGARCTLELKKEVRFAIEKEYVGNLFDQDKTPFAHQVFGYEFSKKEINRAVGFMKDYLSARPVFILIESKLTKANCAAILEQAGIELPAMYHLGYGNNNCIGCVKGGMGYWNKVRVDFPSHFNRMARAERIAGHSCIKGVFLDELDSERGLELKPVVPDCGTYCQSFADELIFRDTEKILSGEMQITEVQ
jgi:hypothetical protein